MNESTIQAPARPPAIGAGLYLDKDTNLKLTLWNAAAGVTVTFSALLLDEYGCVQKTIETLTPTTARAASTKVIPIGIGWLLSAQVIATSGTPLRGQCFARVELINGLDASRISLGTILQDYVTAATALAYPGSPVRASTDRGGVIRSITGTDPALNTEMSETVPTNARWRFRSLRLTLVTGAVVANRLPRLIIDDGATTLCDTEPTVLQPASTTQTYVYAAYGFAPTVNASVASGPLPPDLLLGAGFRLRTSTVNFAAGDNYGAPQIWVEEWIDV